MKRILFARTGYMRYFAGSQKGDERPVGGGAYNISKIGHERFNFKDCNGLLYGFFQPYDRRDVEVKVNLARIDPKAAAADRVEKVLVIVVAPIPHFGQGIIGWYRNATVFGSYQAPKPEMQRDPCYYNIQAQTADSLLLPQLYRIHKIPVGKGAFGRASVVYPFEADGRPRVLDDGPFKWMGSAMGFVENYEGPNLLVDRLADIEQEVGDIFETERSRQAGQGFAIDAKLRRCIEKYAVEKASQYFSQKGYEVDDVGNRRSYDLDCSRGGERFRVEVKGTQSDGSSIILTPNEVKNAKGHETVLFVLHSIKVKEAKGHYRLSGGNERILNPWDIDAHGKLEPLSFMYHIESVA